MHQGYHDWVFPATKFAVLFHDSYVLFTCELIVSQAQEAPDRAIRSLTEQC